MGDEEFATGDAGAASGTPMTCGEIRKNCYVIIKGRPCKIVDTSSSKTGKHGAAKVNFVGIDIFTGKRIEGCHPSSHTVYAPVIERMECSVLHIDDEGFLHLLPPDNNYRSDIAGGDLLPTLREKYESLQDKEELLVTVVSSMGEIKVTECRVAATKKTD
nr:eukaryotic translation initiation factor 5A [Hymenolepis microstoma]